MKFNVKLATGICIVLVIVIAIVFMIGIIFPPDTGARDLKDMRNSDNPLYELDQIIERDEIGKLKLHIYYLNKPELNMASASAENIMNSKDHELVDYIAVPGKELENYIAPLIKLCNIDLVPTEEASYFDVRTYYAFEYKGRKILDVEIEGLTTFVVNDVNVAKHEDFYDIIIPFVSGGKGQVVKGLSRASEKRRVVGGDGYV